MKFKNKLEEDAFRIARAIYGDRAIVEHNKRLRIENALLPAVASFSGPPKKEIDVLGAEILKKPKIDLLVSCKEFDGVRAEPAHVQEWASVINTMTQYSGGTRYFGIVLCPTGFSRGCEPWATSYNLGLVPPLKGRLISYPHATSLRMFERILKALEKRVQFPHDNLFVPPAFYDFCFQVTGDFEGFEESTTFSDKARYFLADSGWRSSFGEIVTTFVGATVSEIAIGSDNIGVNCDNGLSLRVFGDRVVIGKPEDFPTTSRPTPRCCDFASGKTRSFEYVSNLVVGKPITSACDYGDHFEFGVNKDVNLRFHPEDGIIVTEFGPEIEFTTAAELFAKHRATKKIRKKQ